MQYRKLGKWGARVSEVGLGSWLTHGGMVDERQSIEHMHFAFANGINFFDTANVYAHGVAEEVLGKAFAKIPRDEIFIASKVFFPMGEGPNQRGLSRKHVVEQCHASLMRLGMEYIDLYQCHRFDIDVPMEELVYTMDTLIKQGKILYWGVSEWPAAKIQEAVDVALRMNAPPPVSNQPCYNMLHRDIELEVMPVCQSNGVGQLAFSPLAQGVLTGKYKPGQDVPSGSRAADQNANIFLKSRGLLEEPVLRQVEQLGQLAEEAGSKLSQLALAWCLRKPIMSSVIVGATRKEQIAENIEAAGRTLPEELLNRIEDILETDFARVG